MWSLSDAEGRQPSVVSVVPHVLDGDGECSYVDDDIDHDCFFFFLNNIFIFTHIYIYRVNLIC